MRTGKCPKCNSRQVFMRVEEGLHIRGSSYGVAVRAKQDIKLATYVCSECGFVEQYAAEMGDDRKPLSRAEVLASGDGWQKI